MKLNISELVKTFLTQKPHLRDSDNRLIASIWYIELGLGNRVKTMSGLEVLTMIAEGKLSSSESIRRSRQKLQEELPELRGNVYNRRKTVEEAETREEIRNFNC